MLSVWLWMPLAQAAVPLPVAPDCASDNLGACPTELHQGSWSHLSWIPPDSRSTVRPSELSIGSGVGSDVAFRTTTGRFDVPVAILDSGILWDNADLIRKVLLNTDELPRPRFADGTTASTHDADGNGLVNVLDYQWDSRVLNTAGDDIADSKLDASDLIYTFSDGIDGDANGYIDDIAGWDFFEDDNDPYALDAGRYFDHGTGVMQEAVAEGGNGGQIGTCPGCSLLPLRIGDVFVSDGDRVGLAIAYATERGARVVGLAIGTLTSSNLMERAIAYADAHGVVLVAAAGDENSYHHNFPALYEPILYVHSIRSNQGSSSSGSYTFQAFFNCNNYGPRTDFVASSPLCATGATAKVSGTAGLIASAAKDAGLTLEDEEIRSLMQRSSDDIWFSAEELSVTRGYPSDEGWDAFFGYGRVNSGRAVSDLRLGALPPIGRILNIPWFAWFEPGFVEVSGRVAAPRSAVASWALEVGQGTDPRSWTQVASGAAAVEGVLGQLDVSGISQPAFSDIVDEGVEARLDRAHQPLLTLRLTVADVEGRRTEDRRGLFVASDPDLLDGFPMALGGSGESSPKLADLDGDGAYEIVGATGSGTVYALHSDGRPVLGFPVHTPVIASMARHTAAPSIAGGAVPAEAHEAVFAPVAIGDIDGDRSPEIVIASFAGHIIALHADGSTVDGFPVHTVGRRPDERVSKKSWDQGVMAAPILVDVDGDGVVEIIVAGLDQRLYVWRGDGATYPGYPMEPCHPSLCGTVGARIISSPAVGDLDGDGDPDVAFGSNEVPIGSAGVVYAIDLQSAELLPGFPIGREGLLNQSLLPIVGEGHPSAVAMADLDGDGDVELASNPMLGFAGVIEGDGSDALPVSVYRDGFGEDSNIYVENSVLTMINNPAFGDLDLDGTPDFVIGGTGPSYIVSIALSRVHEFEHAVTAWSGASGTSFQGFPRQVDDISFLNEAAIADVSGDGVPEVIYATAGHFVYAWDAEGNIAPGWPKFTGGWVLGGATVGDLDGDGYVEVAVTTREGWLFAWHTAGRADQDLQWASARHDLGNTANWSTPIPMQAGPPDEEAGGCCRNNPESDQAAVGLLALPLWWWRRRRRVENEGTEHGTSRAK